MIGCPTSFITPQRGREDTCWLRLARVVCLSSGQYSIIFRYQSRQNRGRTSKQRHTIVQNRKHNGDCILAMLLCCLLSTVVPPATLGESGKKASATSSANQDSVQHGRIKASPVFSFMCIDNGGISTYARSAADISVPTDIHHLGVVVCFFRKLHYYLLII